MEADDVQMIDIQPVGFVQTHLFILRTIGGGNLIELCAHDINLQASICGDGFNHITFLLI